MEDLKYKRMEGADDEGVIIYRMVERPGYQLGLLLYQEEVHVDMIRNEEVVGHFPDLVVYRTKNYSKISYIGKYLWTNVKYLYYQINPSHLLVQHKWSDIEHGDFSKGVTWPEFEGQMSGCLIEGLSINSRGDGIIMGETGHIAQVEDHQVTQITPPVSQAIYWHALLTMNKQKRHLLAAESSDTEQTIFLIKNSCQIIHQLTFAIAGKRQFLTMTERLLKIRESRAGHLVLAAGQYSAVSFLWVTRQTISPILLNFTKTDPESVFLIGGVLSSGKKKNTIYVSIGIEIFSFRIPY